MKKETPYMQKQHRTVINRTCDSSNNEQNNTTFDTSIVASCL